MYGYTTNSPYHNTLFMNRIFSTCLICLFVFNQVVAQALPDFNSGSEATMYYIQFVDGKTVLQDLGKNAQCKNRNMVGAANSGQTWSFTGDKDKCLLKSDIGNYLKYNRTGNYFITDNTEGTFMKIVSTDTGAWELQLWDESQTGANRSDAIAVVMHDGTGVDKIIDLWTHNFAACALSFIEAGKIDLPQTAPDTPAEVTLTGSAAAPDETLSLWYRTPAKNWTREALPIGNGQMGAMIFGGVAQDRIQFNDKTLWKGTSSKSDLGSYLTFGDIYVINKDPRAASNYRRQLDINEGIAHVDYQSDGDYSAEYFASNPDKVIAVRYDANGSKKINVELQFINRQGNSRAVYTNNGAAFSGKLANNLKYYAALGIKQIGGTTSNTRDGIQIKDADEIIIYLSCGTDFDPSKDSHMHGDAERLKRETDQNVSNALDKGYDALRSTHIADYQSLLKRVDFNLNNYSNTVPTNELLTATSTAAKNMADMLIFQYGRYLAIASSRGVGLPSNLQGIWCQDGAGGSDAVWASDIHTNINVQMNYWPVESTNLSELHMPLFEFLKNEAFRNNGTWKENAKDLIGKPTGWVINTTANIFGGSGDYKRGKYSVANAWLCQHLWQHYAYTQDVDFLRNTAAPLMKSACDFWLKRLVKASDNTYECPNEYSPEQGRIQNAPAHSQQLVTELFTNMKKVISILADDSGCDASFISDLDSKLSNMDKGFRIENSGRLAEWKYTDYVPTTSKTDYWGNDEVQMWPEHRHVSHLIALYPGFEIDRNIDTKIFDAAVASLNNRGDGATGWSRAWKTCLWARIGDAERAYSVLRGFAHRTTSETYDWDGGLYDNMLDAHATSVFQIEGNFGATAGIAEMLLQSRPDSLILLPALPEAWKNGNISGLRAIGNFEVDMSWDEGVLSKAVIKSNSGLPLFLAYPDIEKYVFTKGTSSRSFKPTVIRPGLISINTGAGSVYNVKRAGTSVEQSTVNNKNLIRVIDHKIIVDESIKDAELYSVDGRRLNLNQQLNKGIYIVKAEGQGISIYVD